MPGEELLVEFADGALMIAELAEEKESVVDGGLLADCAAFVSASAREVLESLDMGPCAVVSA